MEYKVTSIIKTLGINRAHRRIMKTFSSSSITSTINHKICFKIIKTRKIKRFELVVKNKSLNVPLKKLLPILILIKVTFKYINREHTEKLNYAH